MAKSKNKKVRGESASSWKNIVSIHPQNFAKHNPILRFDLLDRDGKFAFDLNRPDFKHRHVLEKLIEYSNMTWAEIDSQTHDWRNKTKHHYLDVNGLSPDAKRRISAKHLDEFSDAIYSFAFQNTLRIIGIRTGAEFHVVWYDPEHEFYPSKQ